MKRKIVHLPIFAFLAIMLITACKSTYDKNLSGYQFVRERAETVPLTNAQLSENLTVDMFLMLHRYPSSYISLISKVDSDLGNEFNLMLRGSNTIQWNYGDGEEQRIVWAKRESIIPLNEWVRLTAVRNLETNKMEIYINSELVAQRSFRNMPLVKTTKSPIILNGQGKRVLNISIAEVRIWNEPLTQIQLQNTSSSLKRSSINENLVGFWKFGLINEGKVVDISQNGNDLTITKID